MRIAIDIRCLMSKNYSGVSWFTYNLLQELFRIDTSNQYFLFYNSYKSQKIPEFKGDNIQFAAFNYPNKLLAIFFNFLNWPKIDQMIEGGVDAILVPNFHFVSWSKSCKKIIIVHDLSFISFPSFFNLKMRLWHKIILRKKLVEKADMVVCVSSNTKHDVIELLKKPKSQVTAIYPGVDKKFKKIILSESEKNTIIKKYDLPDKFVLYLGNIEPRKNLDNLILAMSRVDSVLVIAGALGWKCKHISKLIANNSKIKHIGYIDEKDKVALYNLAQVFVYPSFYEGFGLPIIEAMACGTPVICGNNSSQAEIASNAAILVDPFNLSEISTAINQVLNDRKLAELLIDKGYKQADKFNWPETAEKFLSIINNLSI